MRPHPHPAEALPTWPQNYYEAHGGLATAIVKEIGRGSLGEGSATLDPTTFMALLFFGRIHVTQIAKHWME